MRLVERPDGKKVRLPPLLPICLRPVEKEEWGPSCAPVLLGDAWRPGDPLLKHQEQHTRTDVLPEHEIVSVRISMK